MIETHFPTLQRKRTLIALLSIILIPVLDVYAQGVFRANTERTGHYDSEGPRELSEILFRVETLGDYTNQQAGPVVSDGTVYFSNGIVWAVDAEAGTVEWRHSGDRPVEAAPAIGDGAVYVVDDRGEIRAIRCDNGQVRWAVDYAQSSSTPIVNDEYVYSGSQGSVIRFDKGTGMPDFLSGDVDTYRDVLGEYFLMSIDPILLHSEGIWYVAGFSRPSYDERNAGLYAINYESQTIEWRTQGLGEYMRFAGAIKDGVWYVSTRDTVYMIDVESGETIWSDDLGIFNDSLPVIDDDKIYISVATTTNDRSVAGLRALNLETGEVVWEVAKEWRGTEFRGLSLASGVIYAGNQNGTLYAYDADTGEELWTYDAGAAINAPPAIVNGTVYVLSADGVLHGLR